MLNTLHVGAPSLFVTLTAWAAIVLAALVSVLAGLQQAGLPARAAGMFGSLAAAAQAMAALVALGGCALRSWVIRRLMLERVRQEFA